ncbi:putative lipid II flippase FtsW [Helicovermis profundi]|uniref:Probable peptidoglycan glycosyltransferase FtsW n=1 Tax=Helicovermis profundi TaxID=3065157 RepID=A0AAU9E4G5_9FIRM|nr:stage V sporulation protein E [Clostridia bacterium S502]
MKKPFDFVLFIVVMFLIFIGIMMVFSSSYYFALSLWKDKFLFFRKELIFAGVGLVLMVFFALYDYRKLKKLSLPIMIVSITFLIVVLTPLGIEVNGAKRWIDVGITTFMPSEFAKLACIIFCASTMSNKGENIKDFKNGVLPYILIIALNFCLILLQPNLSTAVTISLIVISMLFISGAKLSQLGIMMFAGILAIVGFAFSAEYRLKRMMTLLKPGSNPLGEGWQVTQSLYALGSGGIFGVGLGQSTQNKLYIPEPQNDFIFATIGEELGFIGVVFVLLLFLILIYRGIKIASTSKDLFGCLLASGISAMIAIQVIVNVGVASAILPATGIALPFISYGGNSLVIMMSSIGILLNISRH